MGTSKNRLFFSVPLQFLAFQAAKHAFQSGSSLKTEVFRDVLINKKLIIFTENFNNCVLKYLHLFLQKV